MAYYDPLVNEPQSALDRVAARRNLSREELDSRLDGIAAEARKGSHITLGQAEAYFETASEDMKAHVEGCAFCKSMLEGLAPTRVSEQAVELFSKLELARSAKLKKEDPTSYKLGWGLATSVAVVVAAVLVTQQVNRIEEANVEQALAAQSIQVAGLSKELNEYSLQLQRNSQRLASLASFRTELASLTGSPSSTACQGIPGAVASVPASTVGDWSEVTEELRRVGAIHKPIVVMATDQGICLAPFESSMQPSELQTWTVAENAAAIAGDAAKLAEQSAATAAWVAASKN